MTKRFVPKAPRIVGRIERQLLTSEQLCSVFMNSKYLYEGQRNHGKGKSRPHVRGPLIGNSQQFAGAFCEELGHFVGVDGYHRVTAVVEGNAFFPTGHDIELSVHRVKTVDDLDALYDQFNSAAAGKKSGCYLDSGLRKAGLLASVNSPWVLGGGSATAVQMAAGIKGTAATRRAVIVLKEGIQFCNDLALPSTPHVIAGVKAALFAVAQHSSDKRLAKNFIRNMCALAYEPISPTISETVLVNYRDRLMRNRFGGKTGGSPNTSAFNHALAAFSQMAYLAKGRSMPKEDSMTLAEFTMHMAELKPKKG